MVLKMLGGKRKGHVYETGAMWYFTCQPEKPHTHKHKAVSFPLLSLTFMWRVRCARRIGTRSHTQRNARRERKRAAIPQRERTEGHRSATGSALLRSSAPVDGTAAPQ